MLGGCLCTVSDHLHSSFLMVGNHVKAKTLLILILALMLLFFLMSFTLSRLQTFDVQQESLGGCAAHDSYVCNVKDFLLRRQSPFSAEAPPTL